MTVVADMVLKLIYYN